MDFDHALGEQLAVGAGLGIQDLEEQGIFIVDFLDSSISNCLTIFFKFQRLSTLQFFQ